MLAAKGGDRPSVEDVGIPFLNGLPPTKHPIRFHQNPVLRKKRGDGAGVVLLECLLQLQTKRTEIVDGLGNSEQITLLDYFRVGGVLLLRKGWHCETDHRSGNGK